MENISENYKLTIMKELSVEEKAKRYELALERCRKLYNEAKANEYNSDIEDYETIFPELKEPEDERIRKLLVEAVTQVLQDQYCSNRGVSKEKVVSWLENIPYTIDHEKREGFHLGYKAGFEKQVEQKPAWSEEDETIISALSQLLKDCELENNWNCVYSNDREVFFVDIVNWLKSLRPQPKQEWSEEDQNALEDVREAVVHYWGGETQDILLYWLKSLKQRIGGKL